MSMRSYSVDMYGLLFDGNTLKSIEALYPDKYDMIMNCGVECISPFEGTACIVLENGTEQFDHDYYDCAIYVAPTDKYCTLFSGAYKDMQELVDEMIDKFGEYLPEDFDYRGRIRHIMGTVWG